jgi:hypothetical protein
MNPATQLIVIANLLVSYSLLHAQWTSSELAVTSGKKNCGASSFCERIHAM